MTAQGATQSARRVDEARCVIFGYHEMGYACLEALVEMGAPIAALFTHADAPGEEIWWRSCAELARANSISSRVPRADRRFDRSQKSRRCARK